VAAQPTDEEIFLRYFRTFSVFAAVRNVVCPTSLQGGEKMKPIFRSSPQAAPSKNSLHFFINATNGFRRPRTADISLSAESGCSDLCVKVCAMRKLSVGKGSAP